MKSELLLVLSFCFYSLNAVAAPQKVSCPCFKKDCSIFKEYLSSGGVILEALRSGSEDQAGQVSVAPIAMSISNLADMEQVSDKGFKVSYVKYKNSKDSDGRWKRKWKTVTLYPNRRSEAEQVSSGCILPFDSKKDGCQKGMIYVPFRKDQRPSKVLKALYFHDEIGTEYEESDVRVISEGELRNRCIW